MPHKVMLCKSQQQKLENTKTCNRIAPTYLRRCEEAAATAAAGRDPPPHLGVVVDYERQQQQQQQDLREPWLWQEEEEEEEEGGGTKVSFLRTIVACRVPVPNAQNLECESLIFWVSSPDGSLVSTLAHVSHVKTRDSPCLTSSWEIQTLSKDTCPQVTWGPSAQSQPWIAWKLRLTTSTRCPKSQVPSMTGRLYGNTSCRWGLGDVLSGGSSKKLDTTLNPSLANIFVYNNKDPTLMIINHILIVSWRSKVGTWSPCWDSLTWVGLGTPCERALNVMREGRCRS